MTQWLNDYANLLSVLAGLIIFFSWIIANSVKAETQRLKHAIEETKAKGEIDDQFEQIGQYLIGITIQTYKRRSDNVPIEDQEYWAALDHLTETGLNSKQVDHFLALANREENLSQASRNFTDAFEELSELSQEIFKLYRKLRDALDEVHAIVANAHGQREDDLSRKQAVKAIEQFSQYYREEILESLPPLAKNLVRVVNVRRAEIDSELAQLRNREIFVKRATLTAYALGTLLALVGQMGEKLL